MKGLLQSFDFRSSRYERPTQDWVCGHTAEGTPCRIGPDHRGRCRGTFECSPRREGEGWVCTRPSTAGGKCEQGPLPDGTCCRPISKCVPVRNLRAKRGRVVMWVIILVVGLLTLAQQDSNVAATVSPGALSPAHAAAGSCETCHGAAGSGSGHWIMAALSGGTGSFTESKKCLSCHLLGDAAGQAHSVPAETTAGWTEKAAARAAGAAATPFGLKMARSLFGTPKQAPESLACANCHEEHQGSAFEAVEMSDGRCQSCHAAPFASFSQGHPSFESYPFARRTRINFNHVSHFQRHFPKSGPDKSPQTCMECHQPGEDGEVMAVGGFGTCAACHLSQIEGAGQVGPAGIAAITVLGLDLIELQARGAAIGEWPEFSEARITPFMQALLTGQDRFEDDMRRLEALDLLDLTDSSDDDIAAIERMVWRVKELVHHLIASSAADMKDPLSQALGRELDQQTLARILAVIPADVVKSAQTAWFPNLAEELARRERGEDVLMPGSDATAAEGASPETAPETTAETEAEMGGGDDILSSLAEGEASGGEGDILLGPAEDEPGGGEGDILSTLAEGGPSGGEGDILSGEASETSLSTDILSGGDEGILSGGGEDILSGDEMDILAGGGSEPEGAEEAAEAVEAAIPEMDPQEWAVLGGWYRRDFTLYYKPIGHEDPFMKNWLDLSGAIYSAAGQPIGRAIFEALANPDAPGRCAKCHSTDQSAGAAMQINWTAKPTRSALREITRFSHIKHFSLLDEKGCVTCHEVDTKAPYDQGYKDHNPLTFASNFAAIEQATCLACHAEDRAPESCLTCHRYHVGAFDVRAVPTAMK